jgi:hypothetical protein
MGANQSLDADKWKKTCARVELSRKERLKLQNFLNSFSNYEKFMFDISVAIRDKLYHKKFKSKKIVFVENDDTKIIPLVGLHSTTTDSYNKILKKGFNPPKDKIYGKVENERWPVAFFTNPFLNLYEIYSSPLFCGRAWQTQIITLTNGITRMLRSHDSEFPIIIAIFKDIKGGENNLIASPYSYVESFDKKNILIIGKIIVKFSGATLKYMRDEFEKTEDFDCVKHPKLPLDYTIEWNI